MKFVYIALIPILIVLIGIYAILQLFYCPPVVDKNITVSTDSLIRNIPTLSFAELERAKEELQHPVPAGVWKNNLFDPGRGGAASVSNPGGLKNIELAGIFDNGASKGAVILIKTNDALYGGGYGNYGAYNRPGAADSPPPGGGGVGAGQQKQQVPSTPVKQKALFKVGERLPNGLMLESVGPNFVILRGGSESVKLEMAFFDENSTKRAAEINKASPQTQKAQVTIISGQGGGASTEGTSVGGNSPLVISPGSTSGSSQGIFQGYGR